MHHVLLETWSRRDSFVHRRDPRAKLIALLGFLVAVSVTQTLHWAPFTAYAAMLILPAAAVRLPVPRLVSRAAIVLPFAAVFGVISLLAGDAQRALLLGVKSYLSALGVLLLMATTPLPDLLEGARALGVPRLLILVIQFLYRYLFVISEQAQHMRMASLSRGGASPLRWTSSTLRSSRFRAAAGMVAVLFSRSYSRAGGIYRAMLSRGFQDRLIPLRILRFRWPDAAVAVLYCTASFGVRLWLGGGRS